jgi:hypothetical protein
VLLLPRFAFAVHEWRFWVQMADGNCYWDGIPDFDRSITNVLRTVLASMYLGTRSDMPALAEKKV